MSDRHQPGVRLAEDRVSRKLLWGALAFVVTGIFLFSGWAWLIHDRHDSPVRAPPAEHAPAQLSEVRQTEIRHERPGQRQIRVGREALSRWGWVDREQGIVSVPIEEAMHLVVQEGEGKP
jgi:hypothetical protein